MEGIGSHFANCDMKVRYAEIAAAGNKPQDWKKYIEDVRLKVKSWDEHRRNRMILFIYFNAFKMIPESDKSLDHAQLLIEYAELKSIQDKNGAKKMLAYGRKILPQFAIIHAASAKLEMEIGNKEKALRILTKGSLLEAEPISLILLALHKLKNGRFDLTEDVTDDPMNGISGIDSMRDPSETLSEVIPVLPGYRPSTQEVQPDLDLLTSMSTATLSSSQQKQTHHRQQQQFESPQDDSGVHVSCHLKSPEPPLLHQWKFSERTRDDTCTSSARQTLDMTNSHSYIPETPQGQHLLTGRDGCSTSKRTMMHFSSTPDMRHFTGCDSLRKFRPSNLGPPRRVKIDDPTAIKTMEEEGVTHTRVVAGSLFGCADSWQPDKGHDDFSSEEAISGTLKDISNTRHTYGDISNTRNTCGDISHPTPNLLLSKVSSVKTSPSYGFPFVTQDHHELSAPLCILSYDPPKPVEKIQVPEHPGPSRKLQQLFNADTNNVLRREEAMPASPCYPTVQDMRAQSAQEMLVKQQMVQKQQQLLPQHQQLVPQQQQPVLQQHQFVPQQQQPVPQHQFVPQQQQFVPQHQFVPQQQQLVSQQQQFVSQQQQPVPQQHKFVPQHQQLVPQQQQLVPQQQQFVPQQQQFVQQPQANICSKTFSLPAQQPATTTDMPPAAKPAVMADKKIIYVNEKPYRVLELAGRGGSAKVYKVLDPDFKVVALKCVNLACANQLVVQGYKNEIDLLRKLQHCDRVIKLHDFEYNNASKKLLVVLEYGETDLGSFISQNNKSSKIDPITMRYLWLQMVLAVHAMHKEGVIHSDLKPANFIMVSGKVKLIDFGIAKSLQQDNTSVLNENMVGTPSYMSPEALIAITINPADPKPRYKVGVRSDIWSLGCILYQLTYGHTPFQFIRQKLEAIVDSGHEIPFPKLEDASLMEVLKKCLTRDVISRPTSEELLNYAFLNKF